MAQTKVTFCFEIFNKLDVIIVDWSPSMIISKRCQNNFEMIDPNVPILQKILTITAPEGIASDIPLKNRIAISTIKNVCQEIIDKFSRNTYGSINLQRMQIQFKFDQNRNLNLQWVLKVRKFPVQDGFYWDNCKYFKNFFRDDLEELDNDDLEKEKDYHFSGKERDNKINMEIKQLRCFMCCSLTAKTNFISMKNSDICEFYSKYKKKYMFRVFEKKVRKDVPNFKAINNVLLTEYYTEDHEIPNYFRNKYKKILMHYWKNDFLKNRQFLDKISPICSTCYLEWRNSDQRLIDVKEQETFERTNNRKNDMNYLNKQSEILNIGQPTTLNKYPTPNNPSDESFDDNFGDQLANEFNSATQKSHQKNHKTTSAAGLAGIRDQLTKKIRYHRYQQGLSNSRESPKNKDLRKKSKNSKYARDNGKNFLDDQHNLTYNIEYIPDNNNNTTFLTAKNQHTLDTPEALQKKTIKDWIRKISLSKNKNFDCEKRKIFTKIINRKHTGGSYRKRGSVDMFSRNNLTNSMENYHHLNKSCDENRNSLANTVSMYPSTLINDYLKKTVEPSPDLKHRLAISDMHKFVLPNFKNKNRIMSSLQQKLSRSTSDPKKSRQSPTRAVSGWKKSPLKGIKKSVPVVKDISPIKIVKISCKKNLVISHPIDKKRGRRNESLVSKNSYSGSESSLEKKFVDDKSSNSNEAVSSKKITVKEGYDLSYEDECILINPDYMKTSGNVTKGMSKWSNKEKKMIILDKSTAEPELDLLHLEIPLVKNMTNINIQNYVATEKAKKNATINTQENPPENHQKKKSFRVKNFKTFEEALSDIANIISPYMPIEDADSTQVQKKLSRNVRHYDLHNKSIDIIRQTHDGLDMYTNSKEKTRKRFKSVNVKSALKINKKNRMEQNWSIQQFNMNDNSTGHNSKQLNPDKKCSKKLNASGLAKKNKPFHINETCKVIQNKDSTKDTQMTKSGNGQVAKGLLKEVLKKIDKKPTIEFGSNVRETGNSGGNVLQPFSILSMKVQKNPFTFK